MHVEPSPPITAGTDRQGYEELISTACLAPGANDGYLASDDDRLSQRIVASVDQPHTARIEQSGNSTFDKILPEIDMQERLANQVAETMLYALTYAEGNDSSDHSFAMNLSPDTAENDPENFTYPNRLPTGLCLVDFTGWLPAAESLRFLWMGYRVWNQEGRRMYLVGSPWGYDSLRQPFRYPIKKICLQDKCEYPDLYLQMSAQGSPNDIDQIISLSLLADKRKVLRHAMINSIHPVNQAKNAWTLSRVEASTPCYNIVEASAINAANILLPDECPLVSKNSILRPSTEANGQVGIDSRYLNVQYTEFKPVQSQISPHERLCYTCTSLDFKEIFDWGLVDLDIDLGSIEAIEERHACPFCKVVVVVYADAIDFLESSRPTETKSSYRRPDAADTREQSWQVGLIRNPINCHSTKPFLLFESNNSSQYLGPLVSLATVRGDFLGDVDLRPEAYVDYDLLKRQLSECDLSHGELCASFQKPNVIPLNTLPSLLINVESMALEQITDMDTKYAALSYVWGQKPMLQTSRTNLATHQALGGLDAAELSRVVIDAISVVHGLGLQYLWVDALCIVQDDFDNKTKEIERMANIYNFAYVTLVSLSGQCADDPLPGVSVPRPQITHSVQGMALTAQLLPLQQNALNKTYETRAWTFQERLTSRRCLYFGEHQVYFECHENSASDHEHIFPPRDRKGSFGFNILHSLADRMLVAGEASEGNRHVYREEHLSAWSQLVSEYTSRNLTHCSDVENAFLGIQNVLRQQLGWRFIGGLPIDILDWALLWLPHGQLERRSWQSEHGQRSVASHPPSWSWYGWVGQISYSCYTYLHEPFLHNLRPRVDQYTLYTKQGKLMFNRRSADIWHASTMKDSLQLEAPISSPLEDRFEYVFRGVENNLHSETSTLPLLLDADTTLDFEADTIPAFNQPSYNVGNNDTELAEWDTPNDSTHELHYTIHESLTPDTDPAFANDQSANPLFQQHTGSSSGSEVSLLEDLHPPNPRYDFPFPVEWLNTGPSYGMLRHGLRHNYNDTVDHIARAQEPDHLTLVAMSECDIRFTFRGGQFHEDKAFPKKDQIVMMLVLWDEDFDMAERIAIGYAEAKMWDEMPVGKVERRLIRLK